MERLLDELRERDTTVDNQAVLNKSLQKKLDSLAEELGSLGSLKTNLEVKVSTLEDEKSGLFREIRDLERQLEDRRVKLREAEERLEREILGLETRCKELERANAKELEDAKLEKNELWSIIDDLKGQLGVLEGRNRDLEGLIQNQLYQIEGL